MKYWTQLNELDDAVYKVRMVNSGLRILDRTEEMTSADYGIPEEFQMFLADLADRMDEAIKNLQEKFQNVWDVVREDTFEEDMKAIDDLEEEQNASKRFSQIISNLPTMNSQDNYIVSGAMDDTITFDLGAAQPVYTVDGSLDDINLSLNQVDIVDFSSDNMNTSFHSSR